MHVPSVSMCLYVDIRDNICNQSWKLNVPSKSEHDSCVHIIKMHVASVCKYVAMCTRINGCTHEWNASWYVFYL